MRCGFNHIGKGIWEYVGVYIVGMLCLIGILKWISMTPNVLIIQKFISLTMLFFFASLFFGIFLSGLYLLNRRKYDLSNISLFFYVVMIFFISGCLIAGALTHGEAFRTLLFSDQLDTFMDFYNSIQYGMHPYENKVIYPPLINAIYGALGNFVLIGKISEHAMDIRASQMGRVLFGLYLIFSYLGLTYYIYKLKNGKKSEKIIFICVILFSTPFLFAFERGNSVMLALFFLLIYIKYYRSDNCYLRYLSFFALGFSAGIKISPAIFGFLLVRESRYKDAIIAAVIGVLVFLLPFYLTDGNLFTLLNNIKYTTSLFQGYYINDHGEVMMVGHGAYVNLINTTNFLGRLYNVNLINIANYFNSVILFVAIGLTCIGKKIDDWKIIGILSGVIILCPGFSAVYSLVYILIPLIFFLNTKPENNKKNYMYILFFICMLIPVINLKVEYFKVFINDIYPFRITTFLESLALVLFVVVLEVETFINIYHARIKHLMPWRRNLCCIILISFLGAFYVYSVGFAVRPVDAFYPSNLQIKNASKGFTLENGQYRWINTEAEVYLKKERLLKEGLLVSLPQLPKNVESPLRMIEVFVDGHRLVQKNFNLSHRDYIYITSNELSDINIDGDEVVDIKITSNAAVLVNYIGPAQALEQVTDKSYVDDASSGFYRNFNDKTLWLSDNGKLLLKTSAIKDGLMVKYIAPSELLALNKDVELNIFLNDRQIKTLRIDDLQQNIIVLQPDEMRLSEIDDENPEISELKMSVNASFCDADYGKSEDVLAKSLAIDYIGPCSKRLFVDSMWLSGNEKFYYKSSDLNNDGFCVVYYIPEALQNDLFTAPMSLDLFIDGVLFKHKDIPSKVQDNFDAIVVPPEKFLGKNHIAEIELRLNNGSINMPGFVKNNIYSRSIYLQYVGENSLVSQVDDSVDIDKFSRNINFNKGSHLFDIGHTGTVLLSKKNITHKNLHVKYFVDQLLIETNLNRALELNIYINGNLSKVIPIKENGIFETVILYDELNNLIQTEDDCVKMEFKINGVYNLSKLGLLAKEKDDRSIGIEYIDFEED